MKNFFRKIFGKKEVWRYLQTVEVGFNTEGRPHTMYYHLFESSLGNRKVQARVTGPEIFKQSEVDSLAKRLELYQKKIFRWKNGRRDPDIMVFSQVPEDDMMIKLKGTLEEPEEQL